ncbi:MAG: lysophospholipid acyltransferase family protein [Acetobacteraceae bacterium]|nr:lysophospholipid acyltransferase family protein [Acetobacteraceae bacterium]
MRFLLRRPYCAYVTADLFLRRDKSLQQAPARDRTSSRGARVLRARMRVAITGKPVKKFLQRASVQPFTSQCLAAYLSVAYRTTKWRLEGVENVAPHVGAGAPVIAACWHQRLALMPMLWLMVARLPEARAGRAELHFLVSRHRDGRLIGSIVRRFGIHIVLGSSSRGGAAGFATLLRLLQRGDHIGITPDGPRGPPRQAAAGVAQLAALSGVPVLPCAAQTSRRWVLNSWDKMVIPRPFGRGVIVCEPPISVPRRAWEEALPEIAAAMDRAIARADALCARQP